MANISGYNNDTTPSLADKLLGTDEINGETVNILVGDVVNLVNGVSGKDYIQYKFSLTNHINEGYFNTNESKTNPAEITKLFLNKQSTTKEDLTTLFTMLDTLQNIVISLRNPGDTNNFAAFKIINNTTHTTYFEFDVVLYKNFYSGDLVVGTIYSAYFDVKENFEDKTDKGGYSGTAQDLDTAKQNISQKGIADGYASLDVNGLVPASQLPSYVDDVLEFANFASFPVLGNSGKIYIAIDSSLIYRWSGTIYIEIKDTSAVWGAITGSVVNQTDLIDWMNLNIVSAPFLGTIIPSSTPSGSGAAYWIATQAGTYTNFGGVVVAANSFAVISRDGAGAFSISQTPLDISSKVNVSDVVNNLTSTSEVNPVSALQAKILNDNKAEKTFVNTEINKIQKTIIPINGFCVATGLTVDWENPTLNADWRFATEPCLEGDFFDVSGFVFSTGVPVYGFLDSDNKLISFCEVAGTQFKNTIIAPYRAVRIIHNSVASYENYLVKAGSIVSKLSGKIVEVNDKYNKFTDGVKLQNAYINSSIGATIAWQSPNADNGWRCATEECVAGDVFDVKGFSFSGGIPVYAFLNSSNVVIEIATDVNVLIEKLITAPVNAVRIVFNSQNGFDAYLRKTVSAIGKLKKDIEAVASNDISNIVSTTGVSNLISNNSSDTTDWGWLNVTSAYIGYNEIAESDALLKTARILRLNSEHATINTLRADFVVGIIDQRKNLIPVRTYTLTGTRDGNLAGVPNFEYIKFVFDETMFIKKGEVCFIKVNSISPVVEQTIAINSATYNAANKLLYTRELVSSLTELTGKGAMEFVIETLPYNSIFATKAELSTTNDSIESLSQTVTNNTIFNDSATGLNYKIRVFNGAFILKNLNVGKLLVIGNSMVKDAFTAQTNDSRAMAASVPDHGFADFIASKFGAVLTKMNVFEFEHDFAVTSTTYNFATNWNLATDYDTIVISIGANTPTTDSTSLANLIVSYGQMFAYLKTTNPQAEIYVHTPFQSGSVSNAVQSSALNNYVPFIDTSYMSEFENNSDIYKVGDYYKDAFENYQYINDIGIARHPSDIGHLRIADTLLRAMASTPHTAIRKTITLIQSVGGVISTPNTSWVQGGVVTIRVAPNSGKTISSLTVKDIDNVTITSTQRTNPNGVFYTFIMPVKDVLVTPVFV